jgi:predicted enzyme related to lactoylglutathione lyase
MRMTIRGIDYIYYEVSDLARSKTFYSDTLGLKISSETEQWVEFDCGNVTLGIGSYGQGGAGGTMAALAVDNVETAVEELKSKEVPIVMGPEDFGVCHMAIITDPDGNKLMIHRRADGSVG